MFKRMMINQTLFTACAVTASLSLGVLVSAQTSTGQPAQLPSGHPQTGPQMPTGHPESGTPAFKPVVDTNNRPDANPADVKSVDTIIRAYYDSISGPKGEARKWDRMRSLFMASGRFVAPRVTNGKVNPVVITPEEFVAANRRYFEAGGYFETEIHRTVNEFGNVAQVFSTYESRHAKSEAKPYSRGINSIQLMKAGGRWWIINILWDYENQEAGHQIPLKYLPAINEVSDEKTP